jgi:hypothetical protein
MMKTLLVDLCTRRLNGQAGNEFTVLVCNIID